MQRFAGPKRRVVGALVGALALLACSAFAGESAATHEYLDEETGATITAVTRPLVFAYARPYLAANGRDYVTLAAAAVNRSGKVGYVLISYAWSTVDPRMRDEPLPGPGPLVLHADDRRIQLSMHGQTAHEAGIGVVVDAPAGSSAPPQVYGTDLPTLRFIAEARHLALIVDTERTTLSYDLWEDQRTALRAFVRHMSGEDSP